MSDVTPLTNLELARLAAFLAEEQRPTKSMGLAELQGFLFAIASSPELIEESEWLPLVFNSHDAGYAEGEEPEITGLIRQLYQAQKYQIADGQVILPELCQPAEIVLSNFADGSTFSLWCAGFMAGHDWLEELWEEYLPEDLHDQLTSFVVILSFFASRELADAYYGELKDNDKPFDEIAEQVLTLHADAMVEYAQLGYKLLQAMERIKAEHPKPAISNKVGRNEPCPCGSGKKFKKCCGKQLNA